MSACGLQLWLKIDFVLLVPEGEGIQYIALAVLNVYLCSNDIVGMADELQLVLTSKGIFLPAMSSDMF